jgi:dTDP-4-dehydrorhamnose 3,5-epimerase
VKITYTEIDGVMVVESAPYKDHRGMFERIYCDRELSNLLGHRRIVQINYSRTFNVGAIRGIHFQKPPYSEMKLIRCTKGRVWDVSVDLRKNSSTFLKWHAEELSAENARMVVIPEGLAHGFQVLEPESELMYLHSAYYENGSESGLRHDDPRLNIKWPLAVTDISDRDCQHSLIEPNFQGLNI